MFGQFLRDQASNLDKYYPLAASGVNITAMLAELFCLGRFATQGTLLYEHWLWVTCLIWHRAAVTLSWLRDLSSFLFSWRCFLRTLLPGFSIICECLAWTRCWLSGTVSSLCITSYSRKRSLVKLWRKQENVLLRFSTDRLWTKRLPFGTC